MVGVVQIYTSVKQMHALVRIYTRVKKVDIGPDIHEGKKIDIGPDLQ